jgi:hypothetical protein
MMLGLGGTPDGTPKLSKTSTPNYPNNDSPPLENPNTAVLSTGEDPYPFYSDQDSDNDPKIETPQKPDPNGKPGGLSRFGVKAVIEE